MSYKYATLREAVSYRNGVREIYLNTLCLQNDTTRLLDTWVLPRVGSPKEMVVKNLFDGPLEFVDIGTCRSNGYFEFKNNDGLSFKFTLTTLSSMIKQGRYQDVKRLYGQFCFEKRGSAIYATTV